LSHAEEGGLGAHRAFLAASSSKQQRAKDGARKEASERKSSSSVLLLDDSSTLSDGDDSDASSSSAAGGGASAAAPEQIEGLHKPRTRASSMIKTTAATRSSAVAASSPVLPDASLFALVFPLFAHPALLLWCIATLLVGVLCTTTLAASVPALHEALHLAPVDVYVQSAAWFIVVAPPGIRNQEALYSGWRRVRSTTTLSTRRPHGARLFRRRTCQVCLLVVLARCGQ
jgi:hypothetical protein